MKTSILILFVSAFLLGLRHGVDWDHIAAITDITGTGEQKRKSTLLGFCYILGHALVIILLGLTAVLIGVSLPVWVDQVMEPMVGFTLILLGLWVISSILIHGKKFRLKSRWMILFALIKKVFDLVGNKLSHQHAHPHIHSSQTYGIKTAFIVGVIHGVGAETPTQMVLFATASGVGGDWVGGVLVFLFVLGLIISNSVITFISIGGYKAARENELVNVTLGLITAIFSLIVGTLFLLGRGAFLPALLGG